MRGGKLTTDLQTPVLQPSVVCQLEISPGKKIAYRQHSPRTRQCSRRELPFDDLSEPKYLNRVQVEGSLIPRLLGMRLGNRLFVQYENMAHPETLHTVSCQHKVSQSYFNSYTFVYGTTYIFVPLLHVWCKLLLSKFQCQLLELLLLFTQPSRSYMCMCPREKVSGRKREGEGSSIVQ